jgi:hypothetical protein
MPTARPALCAALVVTALLAGCRAPPPGAETTPASPAAPAGTTAPATAPAVAPASTPTAAWIGQWTGPEGTFLRIEPAGTADRYTLTIQDLDQACRFDGQADGERIRFERDGAEETIRAGDGDATGMKWLAGKRDCLVIAAGEGYCRD